MKLPNFDYTDMRWDAWQAFHVNHDYGRFIQFDTGEFVVCSNSWRPDVRRLYRDLHLQVVGTDDDDCPWLYIPGKDKPIPKSHLNHKGMQVLLLDHDHKRAVSLQRLTSDNAPAIPQRFLDQWITTYYAGPKATPVGAPVIRHYPYPLTRGEREHINELADACKVWLQMQSESEQATLKLQHRFVTVPVSPCSETSFSMLTVAHRTAVAVKGFDMIVKEKHPWLSFNSTLFDNTTSNDDE